MFTDYFGNWFSNWFGDAEEEEPPVVSSGDGGGSGTARPQDPWGDKLFDNPAYFTVEKPQPSVMDMCRLAYGAGMI